MNKNTSCGYVEIIERWVTIVFMVSQLVLLPN